jgi:DNA polymerase-3 subunit epsilon
MASILEHGGAFRVLRRVEITEGVVKSGDEFATSAVAAVLDTETTGLDYAHDQIIELAIRRIRFDTRGRVLKVDRPFSWLEDPGQPLDPEIARITGLSDEQLAGQAIEEARAASLLNSASIVISHNAAFDRPFIEERLPAVRGLPWACSCREIGWGDYGFEGRSLGWLVAQAGWFHEAHRALADVDALITLLQHDLYNGITPLSVLMENARRPGWIVRAIGAHFDVKDHLKARGYRWDPVACVWWREVADEALESERRWLEDFVYRPDLCPQTEGPEVEEVTWTSRYSRRPLEPIVL